MNDQILEQILATTYTLSSLHKRIRALKAYLTTKFFKPEKESEEVSKDDLTWINSLGEDFPKNFSAENLYTTFDTLDQKIKSLKFLTLYLSFLPNDSEVKQISDKLRTDYGKNFLFDIKVNPELVAGCGMVWNGVYKDYSLQGRIDAHKEEILGLFKQYMQR